MTFNSCVIFLEQCQGRGVRSFRWYWPASIAALEEQPIDHRVVSLRYRAHTRSRC